MFREKIFIHTSMDNLPQGETLWLKAYLYSTFPANSSDKILYADLISLKTKRIIKRKVVYLNQGMGQGDFYLGADMPPGDYLLRGYTKWMAEYAKNSVFEKIIHLVAKYGSELAKAEEFDQAKTATNAIGNYSLLFYPEGGSWIANRITRFTVRLTGPKGKQLSQKLTLFSQSGKFVAEFSTDNHGIGTFVLKAEGTGVYAVINKDNQHQKFPLPSFTELGVAMNIENNKQSLKISIYQNDRDTLERKPLMLIGKTSFGYFTRKVVPFGKADTSILLAKNFLPKGLLSFELYQGAQLISQRLIFSKMQNADKEIVLQSNVKPCPTGDSVILKINTSPYAHLSLSVIGGKPKKVAGMETYFSLLSELKDKTGFSATYLSDLNADVDAFVSTLSTKDLQQTSAKTDFSISYLPEKGLTVSGKVVNRNKPMVGANVSLFLSSPKSSLLLADQTDSSGRFNFDNLIFYGKAEIKLTAMNSGGEKVGKIMLDSNFAFLDVPVLPSDSTDQYTAESLATREKLREETGITVSGHLLNEVVVKAEKDIPLSSGVYKALHKDQIFEIDKADLEYKTLTWWMLHNVKGALPATGDETGVVFWGLDTVKNGGAYVSTVVELNPQFVVNGREFFYDDKGIAKTYREQFFDLPLNQIESVRIQHLTGFPFGSTLLVERYVIYLTIKEINNEKGLLIADINGFDESSLYRQSLNTVGVNSLPLVYWKPNIIADDKGEAIIGFYAPEGYDTLTYGLQGKSVEGFILERFSTFENISKGSASH
jgi:hypothetical protein